MRGFFLFFLLIIFSTELFGQRSGVINPLQLQDMYIDAGYLWVITNEGLTIFNTNNGKQQKLGESSGLPVSKSLETINISSKSLSRTPTLGTSLNRASGIIAVYDVGAMIVTTEKTASKNFLRRILFPNVLDVKVDTLIYRENIENKVIATFTGKEDSIYTLSNNGIHLWKNNNSRVIDEDVTIFGACVNEKNELFYIKPEGRVYGNTVSGGIYKYSTSGASSRRIASLGSIGLNFEYTNNRYQPVKMYVDNQYYWLESQGKIARVNKADTSEPDYFDGYLFRNIGGEYYKLFNRKVSKFNGRNWVEEFELAADHNYPALQVIQNGFWVEGNKLYIFNTNGRVRVYERNNANAISNWTIK